MRIARYTPLLRQQWDALVCQAKNGTFLFERAYMDYHADRFNDCSLMFYNDKDNLLALLPAHFINRQYCVGSHLGLTFGGFILTKNATTDQVLTMFDMAKRWFSTTLGATTWIYKPIPHIFCSMPAQEDLYALFRNHAKLTSRKISSTIELGNALRFRPSRRQGCVHAQKAGIIIGESHDIQTFWLMLDNLLFNKHDAHPVHSLPELELLMGRFPNNIHLYLAHLGNEAIAGTLIYEYAQVAHCQYIASNEQGRQLGALDLLFTYLIEERFAQKRFFDFGTSVEPDGWTLNEGLIFQKEGFGGRGIVYDTYELTL
jgi:hypothetical protein